MLSRHRHKWFVCPFHVVLFHWAGDFVVCVRVVARLDGIRRGVESTHKYLDVRGWRFLLDCP